MRRLFVALLVLTYPSAGLAQDWIEFTDRAERFSVNFPGQPTLGDLSWQAQRDGRLPGRVYTVQAGQQRYSLTVVNLAQVAQPSDVKGSIAWEAWNFRKRGGRVTYDGYAQMDRIEGHEIHLANPDRSLTFAGIYMHARRLYILEATVPPNSPGAVHFVQSLIILDEAGNRIRYELDSDGNRTKRATTFGDP
jgi:hypothetical protein